jgi:GNAT superfamily N-acetyltransferase
MALDLNPESTELDNRVSLASTDDAEFVMQLLEEAFTVEPGTFKFLFSASQDPRSALDIWVLKVDGVAVATVTTILVGDALNVWCMATPQRFERRGYGKALLGDVVERSRASGAEIALLSASPAGKPLYVDSGWETLEEWDVYFTAVE